MIDEQELGLWIKRLEAEDSSWRNYERLAILYAIRDRLTGGAASAKALTQRDTVLRWKMDFTRAEAEKWAAGLENADGTTGPHWPIEQTAALADSMGITQEQVPAWCWWITVNMMYADYGEVALHYGIKTVGFFGEMAQAFLFDRDGPGYRDKLAAYYFGIVKAAK